MQKSSWHYWQQWRQRFPLQRDVHFDQGILSNDYCRDCRYCCGPQDCATPFPMKLLPSQQHAHLERDFFLLAPDTACLDDRGCKSCGPEGCLLPRQRRPVACMAREAVNWLVTLAPEDLKQLAIHIPEAIVRERFIDLELPLPFSPRMPDPASRPVQG